MISATLAQLVERSTITQKVLGSIPGVRVYFCETPHLHIWNAALTRYDNAALTQAQFEPLDNVEKKHYGLDLLIPSTNVDWLKKHKMSFEYKRWNCAWYVLYLEASCNMLTQDALASCDYIMQNDRLITLTFAWIKANVVLRLLFSTHFLSTVRNFLPCWNWLRSRTFWRRSNCCKTKRQIFSPEF